MQKTILIIDDNAQLGEMLTQAFEQNGYAALYAENAAAAFSLMTQRQVHVVLLDIMLGEHDGIEVLKQLLILYSGIPVIMITGYSSVETAVQSLKLGAFDYIQKPLDFQHVLAIVENAIQQSGQRDEQADRGAAAGESAQRLVTQNAAMLAMCDKAKKFAGTMLPVLIIGENGTGKEVMADFIHLHSTRSDRAMLKINCAAFPENLLDNELFGHEKGAYTGADTIFKGIFERADGGTLFLDEIGDMPLTIQAKILRALQQREIRRIGGKEPITVDVRFLAATNKDLKKLIREGLFREDLFYRLNTALLHIPPLRERREDIPLLVEYILAQYARSNATQPKRISDAALLRLTNHAWPGNIRELNNVVNYAATVASNAVIEADDLPPDFLSGSEPPAAMNIREDVEKNLILKMLEQTDYNKKKTAEILDMSRRTLYRKLEKYGISVPD